MARREKQGEDGEKKSELKQRQKKRQEDVKLEAAVVLLERTCDREQVRKSNAETC